MKPTEPPDPPAQPPAPAPTDQRKRLPRFSELDQDLWLEFFTAFSDLLTADTLAKTEREKGIDTINPPLTDAIARESLPRDLQEAAELADKALLEVHYRKWIQRRTPPPPRPQARPQRPPPRTRAKGNRNR